MRAIWNGFISFGLVTIPVAVGIAQQRSDVSFRTLSRATMRPVKQKRWDPENDVEVGPDDTVRGYEVSKGTYMAVEDDELERFSAQQEKTIQILQFVDLSEVDPVYFERAYWLEPKERAERPYALLAAAMRESGRAALGRFVLSTKEHLVLLREVDGIAGAADALLPRGRAHARPVGDHRPPPRRAGQRGRAEDGRPARRRAGQALRPERLPQRDAPVAARVPRGQGRRPRAGPAGRGARAGAGDRPDGRAEGEPGGGRGRRGGGRRDDGADAAGEDAAEAERKAS